MYRRRVEGDIEPCLDVGKVSFWLSTWQGGMPYLNFVKNLFLG